MDPLETGLPHREPFILIDDVVLVENGVATGVKTFQAEEPFFAGHFPGDPIVPGVLITEALAQIAGIAGASREPGAQFLLSAIRVMKFHRAVRPGERIELRAEGAGGMGELFSFDVTASVAGEIVADGRVVLSRRSPAG